MSKHKIFWPYTYSNNKEISWNKHYIKSNVLSLFVKALKRLEYTPNTSSHMTILVLHVTGNISLTTAVTTDTEFDSLCVQGKDFYKNILVQIS